MDDTDGFAVINLRKKVNKKKVKTVSTSSSLLDEERNSFTGELEDSFDDFRVASSDPINNKNRRAIALNKKDDSWGFTLQTYGIHQKDTNTLEVFTYVDYVEFLGAAHVAGMRPGDVILAINGKSMENVDHESLVRAIKDSGEQLRMVVLFEDCVRKVDLHRRYLKLKKIMEDKLRQLRDLEKRERRILEVSYNRSRGMVKNQLRESYSSVESSCSGDSTSFSEYSAELGNDIVPIQGRLCASMSLGNITNMQGHRSPRIPLQSSPALSASPLTKRRQYLNASNQQLTRGNSSPCLAKKSIGEDFPTKLLNQNLSRSYEQKMKTLRPDSCSSNSSIGSQNERFGSSRSLNKWSLDAGHLGVHGSLVKSASFSEGTDKLSKDHKNSDNTMNDPKNISKTEDCDNVFIDSEMIRLNLSDIKLQHLNEEDEVTSL